MSHINNGSVVLAYAAISHAYPTPPRIDDNPPLHIFTMSIGCVIGKLVENGTLEPKDALAAMTHLGGKKTPQAIIDTIWGK